MATESPDNGIDSFDEVTLEEFDIYARFVREWLPASASRHSLADRTIRLVINRNDARHVKALAEKLGPQVLSDDGRRLAHFHYHAEPIDALLQTLGPALRKTRSANLLFLHQFGLRESKSVQFTHLHALRHTDLLISFSPNWFQQLMNTTEAQYWGIAVNDMDPINFSHIHRFMAGYFRSLFGPDYFVAPFSLISGSTIFGLIFASHKPLGLAKFLKAAWHKDPYTGETNFDLYEDDVSNIRLALLRAEKILQFQKELLSCLECGKFLSDRDIYLHSLQRGFLGRHAIETVNAFCQRHNVHFTTRTGKPARARLSPRCMRQPRPIAYH
jgi:three-Cys-motif partner protein